MNDHSIGFNLKADLVFPDENSEERYFTAIATSRIVDSQGEIMSMDELKPLIPTMNHRGAANNLGHFGVNVGGSNEFWIDTFGNIIEKYKNNPRVLEALRAYDPSTEALLMRGQIKEGNDFDDMAWEMLNNGEINGVSFGGQLEETGHTACDTMSCGKEMRAKGAFFEVALTGKDLTFPIDSQNPANKTSIILDLKSEGALKAKDFKESEHPRDGGKFSKKPGSGKKPKTEQQQRISKENQAKQQKVRDQSGKLWLNTERVQRIKKENLARIEKLKQSKGKPWKDRSAFEQKQMFENDVIELTKDIDDQNVANEKLEKNIKLLEESKARRPFKIDKDKIQIKIEGNQKTIQQNKNKIDTLKIQRDASKDESSKLLKQAGSDLRKFLANKMGLPDAQVDKIAQSIEQAKKQDAKQQAQSQKESEKKIAQAKKEAVEKKRAEVRKKIEDAAKTKELETLIKNMKPHEIDRMMNSMFKSKDILFYKPLELMYLKSKLSGLYFLARNQK